MYCGRQNFIVGGNFVMIYKTFSDNKAKDGMVYYVIMPYFSFFMILKQYNFK